ncbi:MAG: M20/M25/M40 family metallo-hydrolase [Fibrobacter sp.]|nr:M20/M25/M40 family metallo-hydrolase [Fibrobacter sp.]
MLSQDIQERVLQDLKELCAIPSIAFAGYDFSHLERSAQRTAQLFEEWGFPQVKVVRNPDLPPGQGGAPAVLAAWGNDASKATILLYAHHDVQPEMRKDLWRTPPFEATLKDGRLYARGAADDKAGILIHAAAANMTMCQDSPPVNLRVIIDGEEEVGSPGLERLLYTHRDFLQCQAVIVADLSNFAPGTPALSASLRGMVAAGVTVRALRQPLHSGLWGGPLPDAALALSKILASLCDDQGQIAVPGIREFAQNPAATNLYSPEVNPSAVAFKNQAGLHATAQLLVAPAEISTSLWQRPALTVTTIEAGQRLTAGNVLLDSAWARISLRLAVGMDWQKALQQLEDHLRKNCPWGLELEFCPEIGANAWQTSTQNPIFQQMLTALNQGYGQNAKIIGSGASIPGAPLFAEIFGEIPVLLTGVEDDFSHAHGENESVNMADVYKAIKSEHLFFNSFKDKI